MAKMDWVDAKQQKPKKDVNVLLAIRSDKGGRVVIPSAYTDEGWPLPWPKMLDERWTAVAWSYLPEFPEKFCKS